MGVADPVPQAILGHWVCGCCCLFVCLLCVCVCSRPAKEKPGCQPHTPNAHPWKRTHMGVSPFEGIQFEVVQKRNAKPAAHCQGGALLRAQIDQNWRGQGSCRKGSDKAKSRQVTVQQATHDQMEQLGHCRLFADAHHAWHCSLWLSFEPTLCARLKKDDPPKLNLAKKNKGDGELASRPFQRPVAMEFRSRFQH